jgi:hypothetical protein
MKLYTEEQVMKAYNMGIDDGHNGAISLQINELSLTPIELPSDREIENNAYTDRRVNDWEHDQQIGFERGALWLKEQILNQNK